jgi:hypothetical protein
VWGRRARTMRRRRGDAMTELLSKDHTILERPFMLYRPYGRDERGETISDITGMIVGSAVEYLEECVARRAGPQAAAQSTEELCRQLNERISDTTYHVTPEFLKKTWNGYSYEFVCYVREFCERLSGDPQFIFNAGRKKKISPVFRILGRPFPLNEIYRMYPRLAQECASKDAVEVRVEEVTDRAAILRIRFTERATRQFGPYRKRCAVLTCNSAKGGLSAIPEKVHGLPPAIVRDLSCMADGDEWCKWEVTWKPAMGSGLFRTLRRLFFPGWA